MDTAKGPGNAFDAWYARAMGGSGRTPFPYQRYLAECDRLPELLEVPTGTGKTAAAILGWLWRRSQKQWRESTPRRLVYCLPMRVLVEQTRACAVRWLNNLGLLAGRAMFTGDRLERYEVDWGLEGKVAVVTLMGGESQRDWREHPEHDAILVGTQDMLLSRALNRGFAMPPQMWPVDFGLLNVDAFWVMDEVQLMGSGRTTSVQLQQFWYDVPPSHGLRQTIWMSATLGSSANSLELPGWMKSPERASRKLAIPPHRHTDADLGHEEFRSRWTAPKRQELRLHRAVEANATGKPPRSTRRKASAEVGQTVEPGWTVQSFDLLTAVRREADGGRLVLVFVNQVKRARDLHARLRDVGTGPEVLLIHARMRPHDRQAVTSALESPTPDAGRVIVTTQVLEAGVDIDADALFTELCPWPSLVQRLGRLNRTGTRPRAEDVCNGLREPARAVVFEPPSPSRKEKEAEAEYEARRRRELSLPYDVEAIEQARALLCTVEAEHDGSLSPEALSKLSISLPIEGPVLRRFDLDDLFDTDPDLSGGHTDVSPLLRAADRDVDAYLFWRRIEHGLDADDQVPFHRDELCAVPFYEAQRLPSDCEVWILSLTTDRKRRAAWRNARGREIRAGDTVMIDLAAGCYREDAGWTADPNDVPALFVDRWAKDDGTLARAWVRLDGTNTSLVREIDGHVVGARARLEDHRCFAKTWMELDPHLRAAEDTARELVRALGLDSPLAESVIRAARWHDVGKALERDVHGETRRPFQNMLLKAGVAQNGHPRNNALYAKSNKQGGPSAGFRHEMASLLAFLQSKHANDDLAAFLILAHHGKVRMLPEAWGDEDPVDLCGVQPGDRVPRTALPEGNGHIELDLAGVLPSRERRGWQGRVGGLVDKHGPFLVAYLEGLVRVADWRAS
jgi:CRISPR-associated endonuclease/helicase Cas3